MSAAISRFDADAALPRSFGAVDLEFRSLDGATRASRVFQQGVMRARFPNVARHDAPEAVLINTAGGLTGGDRVSVRVDAGAGAHVLVTTQAHEKVYRSVEGDVEIAATLQIGGRASLEWLPQPTILFDKARLRRQTSVEMADDAIFLGVEAVIFGRTAMQETVNSGALSDGWIIRRGGRLIHADRFEVSGEVGACLARASVLAGHAAMATLRYVAPDAPSRLDEMRDLLGDSGAASAWNNMLLARLVVTDGYQLGVALARTLAGFRRRPLPPVWSI